MKRDSTWSTSNDGIDIIKSRLTSDDATRLNAAYDKYMDSAFDAIEATDALYYLAYEIGDKMYEDDVKNGKIDVDSYTPRQLNKLKEYYHAEQGYEEAKKQMPKEAALVDSSEELFDDYKKECINVGEKILGKYANTKVGNASYSQTAAELVAWKIIHNNLYK